MDKNSAKRIIQETFQNPFDKNLFIHFTKELFNKIDEATFIYRGNTVPQAYQPFIHTLERIGKYIDAEDNKIDVLIVHLKKEKSIQYARTMQRNFIAWYLNGSRGGELKDAAIVAFHTDDPNDWRFSLIKMDYQITQNDKGKSKLKKELTPAKRFSFLVGKHENSHTAQKQLLPILEDDEHGPLLSSLEQAFNIEIVTKEFFTKYRELFLNVKDALDKALKEDLKVKNEFTSKAVETPDFAKKLLGQIVFLYFLQKKGWFGVARDAEWGTGPKDFLYRLYDKQYCDYKNFFNEILEPLFYNALAVERQHDWSDRFNCKIPFLNGGLFDPLRNYDWVHTDIELPNELFHNEYKTKEGDTGTGILDIFDRYNFTVKEDEPLEKEVAVDPEMLGKVFENLLEVKDRKSKGTYYTPREIVHYMCQQSLINYLATEFASRISKEDIEQLVKYGDLAIENEAQVQKLKKETETYYHRLPDSIRQNATEIDDRLANIKVCDPAIGSGAFPVGMMNEIVKVRNVLLSYLLSPKVDQEEAFKQSRSLYSFKRDCIQNSLYGVDIDPGAVEIAKLRLWLSLIVDEEDIREIKPLPNLDYKIMQGNSLLEEFEGIKLFDEKLLESPIISAEIFLPDNQKIISLQSELLKFYMKNPEWMKNKDAVKPQEVMDLEIKLRLLLKQQKRLPNNSFEQKDLFASVGESKQIRDELESLHKKFFGETNKRKKEELKRRIDNLEWDLIEASLQEQKKTSALKKLEKLKQANTKPFFLWKLNFAEVFQEKGGFDIVIANPPYIDSESMIKNGLGDVREVIQKNYKWTKGNWDIYIAFFELGFKEMNKNGTLTFITPDKWISKPFGDEFRKNTINNIVCILNAGRKIFDEAKVDSIISFFSNKQFKSIKIVNLEDNGFVIQREINKDLLSSPFTLDHLFSDNLSFLSKLENLKSKISDFAKCESACATSDAYKLEPLVKNLEEKKFDAKKYLKIINTGTIGKYYMKWGKREMTYLKHKYLFPVVDKKEFLSAFTNSYSTKSLQPKIIIKGLNLLDGCLDDNGTVIPGKTTLIVVDRDIQKLKFLLTIINSKLSFFYIKERYPAASYNQGTSFTKDMVNNLPLPDISIQAQRELVKIAEKISTLSSADDYSNNLDEQAKVRDLERQIDEMVYKLYGLTSAEVKIVEAN